MPPRPRPARVQKAAAATQQDLDYRPPGARRAVKHQTPQSIKEPEFRIGLDFGTTMASAAFGKGDCREIITITNYADDPYPKHPCPQVPMEIMYAGCRKKEDKPTDKEKPKTVTKSPIVTCGYEIKDMLTMSDDELRRIGYSKAGYVTKSKLLLDESSHLQVFKHGLLDTVEQLKRNFLIEEAEDIIEHQLIYLLNHVKNELESKNGLKKGSSAELTICVPVAWGPKANAKMSLRTQNAMRAVGLGGPGILRFFIVNEAEAAASYALQTLKLAVHEIFLLIDCGGGTTDVGIYKVDQEYPLRLGLGLGLGAQIGQSTGIICGSGELNDLMRIFAKNQLASETYLEDGDNGVTISNIIELLIIPAFEDTFKRTFNLERKDQKFTVPIMNLRAHPTNPRLKANRFVIYYEDVESIFAQSLNRISTLMQEQIFAAWDKGVEIDKVVVVGGYGDSPALQQHLKNTLQVVNGQAKLRGNDVEEIKPIFNTANAGATGVAIGAVMRARNKENGPKRTPWLSFGVLHHVPEFPEDNVYPPRVHREVLKQGLTESEVSGDRYVMNTIRWLVKVNQGEVSASHTEYFISEHPFYADEENWVVEEVFFTSDVCTKDYYKLDHPNNKDKFANFAKIEFNLNHLREHIEAKLPLETEDDEQFYSPRVKITLTVIGRHIEFAAFWPHDDPDAVAIPGNHKGFEISSLFRPGTA